MPNLKLVIYDSGDMSVGFFPQTWSLDVPLSLDADKEERELFRKDALRLYADYSDGKLRSCYSDEIID